MPLTNRMMKGQQLSELCTLLGRMSAKVQILDALDRDPSQDGCWDLSDQLTTIERQLARLEEVFQRAKSVNGLTVDEEYEMLFGDTDD